MFGFLREIFKPETLGKPQPSRKRVAMDNRSEALAALHEQADGLMTPERAELVRKAMEVRRAKQAIFADLDDAQRQKLVAVAIRRLLNEAPDDGKTK